jgi:Spy/CpxP family protein refolding chaperone
MLPWSQIAARPNCLLLQAMLAFALLVVLFVPKISVAQHHGGGPGGFPGGGMPGGPGGMAGGDFSRSGEVPSALNRDRARMHAGLQVGPPGRWWDDKHYAKQLKLTEDQQHRMDAIFEQSRPVLLNRLESLEREEQRMDALTHSKTLDEAALFSQIDRIEQARADLGKANTHYLVQLRSELDADQISRLEAPH